jgi:flagellar hook protein FlgE
MFEVYVPRSREAKKIAIPEVKISKQSIVMNKNARNLLRAERLELAYDEDNRTIRIKRAEENGINIKKTKVYAKGFLEHFNIQEKGRFMADYKEDEDALYVRVK